MNLTWEDEKFCRDLAGAMRRTYVTVETNADRYGRTIVDPDTADLLADLALERIHVQAAVRRVELATPNHTHTQKGNA